MSAPFIENSEPFPSFEESLKVAESILEQVLFDFNLVPTSGAAYSYNLLRLQATIFHYDIVYDFTAFSRPTPEGFAEKLALKKPHQ